MPQIHVLGADVDATGFDFGEVEDIVDEDEEIVSAGLDVLQIAILTVIECVLARRRSIRVYPMMAFIGVHKNKVDFHLGETPTADSH